MIAEFSYVSSCEQTLEQQANIDEGNWFSFKRANQHILKWEKHNGVTQPGEAL